MLFLCCYLIIITTNGLPAALIQLWFIEAVWLSLVPPKLLKQTVLSELHCNTVCCICVWLLRNMLFHTRKLKMILDFTSHMEMGFQWCLVFTIVVKMGCCGGMTHRERHLQSVKYFMNNLKLRQILRNPYITARVCRKRTCVFISEQNSHTFCHFVTRKVASDFSW